MVPLTIAIGLSAACVGPRARTAAPPRPGRTGARWPSAACLPASTGERSWRTRAECETAGPHLLSSSAPSPAWARAAPPARTAARPRTPSASRPPVSGSPDQATTLAIFPAPRCPGGRPPPAPGRRPGSTRAGRPRAAGPIRSPCARRPGSWARSRSRARTERPPCAARPGCGPPRRCPGALLLVAAAAQGPARGGSKFTVTSSGSLRCLSRLVTWKARGAPATTTRSLNSSASASARRMSFSRGAVTTSGSLPSMTSRQAASAGSNRGRLRPCGDRS